MQQPVNRVTETRACAGVLTAVTHIPARLMNVYITPVDQYDSGQALATVTSSSDTADTRQKHENIATGTQP